MKDRLQKHGHWVAFFWALGLALLVFLPFVIMNKGMFFYYGDFNVQQIPFYQHAHDMVRSGQFFWDTTTDLGVNFIGSYSFYVLFSPFFWLTLPFPTAAIPYLMAPLLALKTACAALTSYLFIKRFVTDRFYAVIGSLLYAFSGFMVYNVFFNHFHEAVVFFPLMLVGLEELLCENRRGVFALAVAINAIVNYWFFIGEVIFIILYFIVRSTSKDCRFTFGRFFSVAFEGMLGVALSAVVFLPSVLAILGNPRTGTDSLIQGWSMWVYSNGQRYLALLHSLFFPPDLASLPNFFPDHGAKWASLAAWLPLFGATGALAFCGSRKGHWLRRMLIVSAFFAAIPVLNSAFVLFNGSYYTRWFYMPILMLCVATVIALEQKDIRWKGSLGIGLGVILAIALAVGVSPKMKDGVLQWGLANDPLKMWGNTAIALVCLGLTAWLVLRRREGKTFPRLLSVGLSAVCVVYSVTMMAGATTTFSNNEWMTKTALSGRGNIDLPDNNSFVRVDVFDGKENLGLYWDLPSIQAFHSIVPASIMEFYPSVGVKRDVSSKPEKELYALRSLLSVRWLFIEENNENQEPMPGYTYYDNQVGHNIYENENYITMGFAYDDYITFDQWDQVGKEQRGNLLLAAVLLEDDAVARNADLLTQLDDDELFEQNDYDTTEMNAADRNAMSASQTSFDRYGFTSHTAFGRERLIFYSVPWDSGWVATVNGQPAVIEKVNNGFMAVRAPEGEAEIRFDYYTPGLYWGGGISTGAAVIWLLYTLLGNRRKRGAPAPQVPDGPQTDLDFDLDKPDEPSPQPSASAGLPPLPAPIVLPPLNHDAWEKSATDWAPPADSGKQLRAGEEPKDAAAGKPQETAMGDAWRKYEAMLQGEDAKNCGDQ